MRNGIARTGMSSAPVKLTPLAIRLLEKQAERLITSPTVTEAERRIHEAMDRAAARRTEHVEPEDPATLAILREQLLDFNELKSADAEEFQDKNDPGGLFRTWWGRVFDFIFSDGPHPGLAVRRLYMLARRYRPDLINHMNGTDLGIMWGDTRAAQAHRINLLFDGLRAAGVRGNRGGGCKREDTRGKFAAAAKGNRNRATGKSKAKAKTKKKK
jgi:hypothetical protein